MFGKGPQPGATPRADALKVHPGATCVRVESICDLRGYIVYDSARRALVSAGSAQEAWRKAQAKTPYPPLSAKRPKWLYIAEYRCGCSEDSTRRNELIDYCGKHGENRLRVYKVPNPPLPQSRSNT